jgi:hypothetical protein
LAKAPKTFRARFELPAGTEHYVDPVDDAVDSDDPEQMTEEELSSLVDGQINDAKLYESVDLIELRAKALKFFEGQVDIVSAPGRSQVVSRDVSDTHGLIMPGLMRVFLATDNIAIYNPVTPADEPFARQITDYVNYVVMKECNGYIQFRSAFHNGLLMGNGPIKHWWDATPKYSTESFSGLPDDAYTMLVMDPDVEVIEHDEYDDPDWSPPPPPPPMPMGPAGGVSMPLSAGDGMPPGGDVPMGQPEASSIMDMPGNFPQGMPVPQAPQLHDCKLKRCTSKGRLRVEALAPEDLLLGRGTLSLDEDHVRFAAHRWIKTRSALIKEGFDEDKINDLPSYTGVYLDTPESLARDRHHLYEGDRSPDKSTELIEGFECYLQCDYDGDSVAEWRKVVVAGHGGKRALLENEEWGDDLPFSDIVPDPVPHRWRGRSLYDMVEDVQRIKTVLMRQTLDNVYLNNTPRQKVIENSVVNPEVLQDWEIGSTLITRTADAVSFDAIPFTADKSFGFLEYFDQIIEKRTGVSRSTVALDMDVLQDQTATAVNAQQATSHTKVEEYARNIAEHGGLKRVFSKILKLVVKHQDRARTVRLRDGWVTVDPRAWNADMDVTINTGLGTGSRERDLTMLMGIAAKQEAVIMQLGPTNPVLGLDKLFVTYRKLVEATGVKPPEQFFPEISPEVMQQMAQTASQKVDPKVQAEQMRTQADQQLAQLKTQSEGQIAQLNAQLELRKIQTQAELNQHAERLKATVATQTARFSQQMELARAQRDAQLQQIQLDREAQVEERQAQADIAVKDRDAQWKARLEQMKFQQEAVLEKQKFEFQKKLELLKVWAAIRTKVPAPSATEPEAELDKAAEIEIEDLMATEQDVANGGGGGPLHKMVETQTQLAQAITGLGEQLVRGHAEHSQNLASVLQEISKPKEMQVVRDENNRVIGSKQVH